MSAVLANKTALITGASRGIGQCIFQTFATHNVKCILLGRDPQTLTTQLAQAPSGDHSFVVGDVASPDVWREIGERNVSPVCFSWGVI